MSFNKESIRIKYRSNSDDIVRDFMVPVLKEAKIYKRAVGYFSSSSLVKLTVGLFKLAENGGKIQLICSPKLSKEDIEAIDLGYKNRETIIEESMLRVFDEPINEFEEERLNLVATLISRGVLEIKVAFMENDIGINIYHEKIAVLIDEEGNKIGFTGSMNESENAYEKNFESIYVFRSWNEEQSKFVDETELDFKMLWEDATNKVMIMNFPDVVKEKLLTYQKNDINFETDYEQFRSLITRTRTFLEIPNGIIMKDYQEKAIENWKKQNYRSIFDMATGTGKSYTALYGIVELAKELDNNLAVFIVCPYKHLVGQWEEDLINWGVHPIIGHSESPDKKWDFKLINAYKRFRRTGKPFICITTNTTFTRPKVQKVVSNISEDMNVLLIVDEAHNFGAKHLSKFLNESIKYRIALSATIERHMDSTGTKKLYDYFGDKCIEYLLEQAIREGKSLVEYEYYPKITFLENDELNEYQEWTRKLRKQTYEESGKRKFTKKGQLIIFKRTRILAGARNKTKLLMKQLEEYKRDKFILVYCGATSTLDEETGEMEKQIVNISSRIETELGMDVHKFTAEESAEQRMMIKECYANGLYQVLTAIKCLDEGVNIPNIRTAFIMSSSRNPKEFIQRRGRLLRKAQGKKRAVIYDYVTLPRSFNNIKYGDYDTDKSIIVGELARILEFGRMSMNRIEADNVIDEIQDAYGVSIDIEDEITKYKEEFDE